jgi:ubiquinone/menaquinone biosynthesis C-methylase UbiE
MLLFKLFPTQFLSQQASKPSGLFGRYLMTALFNKGNAGINSLVKTALTLKQTDHVLEIGFGPGKLIHEMADMVSQGSIKGIDYSQTMCEQASRVNAQHIANGKVELQQGECKALPYDDNTFDKACGVNVIYFWADPVQCFKELYRVIKPGGQLVIGFRNAEQMQQLALDKTIFTSYSNKDVLESLKQAGFINTQIIEQADKPLTSYCTIANTRSVV